MSSDQKKVLMGTVSGIVPMCLSLWLFFHLLPDPEASDLASRIGYALKWDAVAALPLFFMLAVIGNGRFDSEATESTLG